MTIREVINQLNKLTEKEKDLPLYACNDLGDNMEIKSINLYDENALHDKYNPLGANY